MALNILNKGKRKDAAPKAEVRPKPTRGERLADAARELTHLEEDRRAAEGSFLSFTNVNDEVYAIRSRETREIMRRHCERIKADMDEKYAALVAKMEKI